MGNLEFAKDESLKCKKGVRFPYADADGVHWEETVFRGITLRMLWLVFVLMITTFSSPAAFAQEIKTCGDFAYQDDAQKFYDSGGGRPQDWYGGMDQNNDGVACEHLPAKPMHLKTGFRFAVGSGVGLLAIGGVILWRSRGERLQTGVSTAPAPPSPTRQVAVEPSVVEVQSPPQVVVHVQQNVDSSSRSESVSRASSNASSGQYDDGWMTPEKARNMPYEQYLQSRYWKAVRKNNIARANGKCTDCGRGDQVMQVHHLSYDYLGKENDDFLVVLCPGCHKRRHDLPLPPRPQA